MRARSAAAAPPAIPVLAGATVAVSFSAIFIRIAGDGAGTIVWLRMSMAAALLAPWAVRELRHGALPMTRGRFGIVVVSGVLLAGHFLLWTASLGLTSIAASVLLVSMHPVIVTPLSRRFLGDRVPPRALAGMLLALAGTVVTCAGDVRLGGGALLGDLLALGGATCLAGYLLIGRGVRGDLAVAGYSAIVFGIVALTAVTATAAAGVLHRPSARTAWVCLALAVVCTLGGHTAYNWALRHVRAATVSVAFLGEAPLTALLGFALLASVPAVTTIAGGAVILAGVAITLSSAGESPSRAQVAALE